LLPGNHLAYANLRRSRDDVCAAAETRHRRPRRLGYRLDKLYDAQEALRQAQGKVQSFLRTECELVPAPVVVIVNPALLGGDQTVAVTTGQRPGRPYHHALLQGGGNGYRKERATRNSD